MIFLTVGTDGPFDRLVNAVDRWAGSAGRQDVFAQIGHSQIRPSHIRFQQFLDPLEFTRLFSAAELVVAHAGMGTILSALRHEKPLLVMPRRASLGEQRNEHQLATARHLMQMGKVTVAFDEEELIERLGRLSELQARAPISAYAEPRLTATIRTFIDEPLSKTSDTTTAFLTRG